MPVHYVTIVHETETLGGQPFILKYSPWNFKKLGILLLN